MSVLEMVMRDDSFHLDTEVCHQSVSIAGALLVMGLTESTRDTLFGFGHGLVLSLGKCLDQSIQPPQKNGGRCLPDLQVLWSSFHELITSDSFHARWTRFLQRAVHAPPCPVLSVFITKELMDRVIMHEFPLDEPAGHDAPVEELTLNEGSGLRYVCGYILREVHEDVQTHPMKEALTFGLNVMVDGEGCGDGTGAYSTWLECVDRGGLVHISNDGFRFFYVIEMEVRRHLSKSRKTSEIGLDKIKKSVMNDVDVL